MKLKKNFWKILPLLLINMVIMHYIAVNNSLLNNIKNIDTIFNLLYYNKTFKRIQIWQENKRN